MSGFWDSSDGRGRGWTGDHCGGKGCHTSGCAGSCYYYCPGERGPRGPIGPPGHDGRRGPTGAGAPIEHASRITQEVQSLTENGLQGKKRVLLEILGPQAGSITIDAQGVATIGTAGTYTVTYGIVALNTLGSPAWVAVRLEVSGVPLAYTTAQGTAPGNESLRLVCSGQFTFDAGAEVSMAWFGESFEALRISDGDPSQEGVALVSPSYAWLNFVLLSENP